MSAALYLNTRDVEDASIRREFKPGLIRARREVSEMERSNQRP